MKIEIIDARDDGRGHWVIDRVTTLDDGSKELGVYVMPLDTLEWRAAEYGIDPSDVDTLMDVVLAEHHLTPEEHGHVPVLFTADTVDEARRAHLAACAAAKLRCRISTRGSDHVLNRVKTGSPMHPDAINMKRKLVDHARRHQRGIDASLPARTDEKVRLDSLRTIVRDVTGEDA